MSDDPEQESVPVEPGDEVVNEVEEKECDLEVSNLTRNVKKAHLQEIFSTYGTVKDVDLQTDKRSGLSKGIARVTFLKEKEAEQAMFYLNGGQIDGKEIKVTFVLVSSNKRRREDSDVGVEDEGVKRKVGDREIKRGDSHDRNAANNNGNRGNGNVPSTDRGRGEVVRRGDSRGPQSNRDRPAPFDPRNRYGGPTVNNGGARDIYGPAGGDRGRAPGGRSPPRGGTRGRSPPRSAYVPRDRAGPPPRDVGRGGGGGGGRSRSRDRDMRGGGGGGRRSRTPPRGGAARGGRSPPPANRGGRDRSPFRGGRDRSPIRGRGRSPSRSPSYRRGGGGRRRSYSRSRSVSSSRSYRGGGGGGRRRRASRSRSSSGSRSRSRSRSSSRSSFSSRSSRSASRSRSRGGGGGGRRRSKSPAPLNAATAAGLRSSSSRDNRN